MTNSIITGTGSYIAEKIVPNHYFSNHTFFGSNGIKLERSNDNIIEKFKEITCIEERRYVSDELATSDMACFAAEKALENTDRETLDGIIGRAEFWRCQSGVHPIQHGAVHRRPGKAQTENSKPLHRGFRCPIWMPRLDSGNDTGRLLYQVG